MKQYLDKRLMAVLLTSMASGLPLLLTKTTLQAWYTTAHVNILLIGMLSLVGLPYNFKFLWAPIMDRFVPFKVGRRKGWLFVTQILVAVSLLCMAGLTPDAAPTGLAILAIAVAFFSASQDIVVDAYRSEILPVEQHGMGASLLALGYRLAMLVGGAFALVFAGIKGWHATYVLMAVIMCVFAIISLKIPEESVKVEMPATLHDAVVKPFSEFWQRPYVLWIIAFVISYKLCDAFALSLNTTFLIRYLHFSLSDIGYISKTVSMAAVLIGSLVGGLLLPRLRMFRALFMFGIVQMLSNLLFAWMAWVGKSYALMVGCLFVENFCGGLSTVAFVAFLMGLCDQRFTATQYAIFSAVAAIGVNLAGPIAAYMVLHVGWVIFYIFTCLIGLPSLCLLVWLRRHSVIADGDLYVRTVSEA